MSSAGAASWPTWRLLTPVGVVAWCLAMWWFLRSTSAEEYDRQDYTLHVGYEPSASTLTYGNPAKLREKAPLLPDDTYAAVVRSMPIVCVDVLLQRADGRVLLVKRHAEPVRGLYWVSGGRLLRGETFAAAAVRKVRDHVRTAVRRPASGRSRAHHLHPPQKVARGA